MPGYFFHIAIERLSPAISLSPHIDIFESELTNHISKASANHRGDASAQSAALGHRDHTPTTHAELPKSVFGVQGRATLRPTLPNQNTPRNDRRIDNISIRGFDMEPSPKAATSRSDMTAQTPTQTHHADQSAGLLAKGIFIPSPVKDTDVGLGIVHLYRDGQETPGLYDVVPGSKEGIADADCRILCILAVPSYMTPSDFLGFVGEQTKGDVSHFRLVKTERANRYMVLMKFRESQKAREWWKEWNGKRFNNMEVSLPLV